MDAFGDSSCVPLSETSKQANKQANKQASKQTNKQTSKWARISVGLNMFYSPEQIALLGDLTVAVMTSQDAAL